MKRIVFHQDVYTFHIDFAGHVSNIVYIQWMEIGRLKLLEAVDMRVDRIAEQDNILPTLVATEIQYKKPLFLGDRVRIEVWLSSLKNVSAVVEFRFFNQAEELTTTGRQTGLFINATDHKPHRISKEQRTAFANYLAAP
ncbi:MAG: acyl-CoA thioesterase [Desulfobulbus sp.]|nr:MAG: acyl-CoA thioesterase [Desulfobulbus sp.]RUM37772.1 MAG: acyl-CoA thioesterase [Desulfobulbus sp.]